MISQRFVCIVVSFSYFALPLAEKGGCDVKKNVDMTMKILRDFLRFRREDKTREPMPEGPDFKPEELLKALGVEIKQRPKEDHYIVGFQGGDFLFRFNHWYLSVVYFGFMGCSCEQMADAVFAANYHNRDYMGWTCYVKQVEDGLSLQPVQLDMSHFFFLAGPLEGQAAHVRMAMMHAFKQAREIVDVFEKISAENKSLDYLMNESDFTNKLALTQRLLELKFYADEVITEREDGTLTVEMVLKLFRDTDLGCLNQMRLVAGDEVKTMTEVAEIMQLDLKKLVADDERIRALDDFTLLIYFEKQNVVANLKKLEGSTGKSLFYSLNVMRTGLGADMYSQEFASLNFKTVVEIRLTTEQEDYWEVKFMVDDAREKVQAGNMDELSDEQKLLLMYSEPALQTDGYWGKRLFTKGCYFQALFFFRRIYKALTIHRGTESEKAFCDTALHIGFIYCLLNRYDRAFYYLDKARRGNTVRATEVFIDCLCTLRDPDALVYIKNMLDQVKDNLGVESGDEEVMLAFYAFLAQRYAHTLIDNRLYDEAELFLNRMVLRGEDADFVKEELRYLERKRKGQNDGQA